MPSESRLDSLFPLGTDASRHDYTPLDHLANPNLTFLWHAYKLTHAIFRGRASNNGWLTAINSRIGDRGVEGFLPRSGGGGLAVLGGAVLEEVRVLHRVQHVVQPRKRVAGDVEDFVQAEFDQPPVGM